MVVQSKIAKARGRRDSWVLRAEESEEEEEEAEVL